MHHVEIKNCPQAHCNGRYTLTTQNFVDRNTASFEKDSQHYLYRHNSIWCIGSANGVIYIELSVCLNRDWDMNSYDFHIGQEEPRYNEVDLSDYLQRFRSREIVYIPNPGNAGDSLIADGTLRLLDKVGLSYRIGHPQENYSDRLLFYAGGGNLTGLYENCRHFLLQNKEHNEIVILPHTIMQEDDLIRSFGDNITIFCREKMSYKYVHELAKHKDKVLLSPDLAFYIDDIDEYKNRPADGICQCLRMDIEKTGISISQDNIDLSHHLIRPGNTSDKAIIRQVSLSTFDWLANYSVIHTNRLHLAIVGSLLGRDVTLRPNNYYKNRAIYDYSLQPFYPKTRFVP